MSTRRGFFGSLAGMCGVAMLAGKVKAEKPPVPVVKSKALRGGWVRTVTTTSNECATVRLCYRVGNDPTWHEASVPVSVTP